MKSNVIPFRIRKVLDDDLREALEHLPANKDRSEVIREALRAHLLPKTVVHPEPAPVKKNALVEIKPVKVTRSN